MEEAQNPIGKFLDPKAIISQLDLKSGAIVADFGCGPGYFSLPFAQAVGHDGKVYSLDILPQVLETVEGKAKNIGISNIIVKRVNLENANGSKLENDSVDWVVLKDVLFQNKQKEIMIKEAYRILKSAGRVLVIEWNAKDFSIGPDENLRIKEDDLRQMFAEQGFKVEKDIAAGSFHYSFVVKKQI